MKRSTAPQAGHFYGTVSGCATPYVPVRALRVTISGVTRHAVRALQACML